MGLIDCFTFYNNFDVLKIRLEELAPYVDHFVLVECTHTFSGLPKPLYFKENPITGYKINHVVTEPIYAYEVNEELSLRNVEQQVRGYEKGTEDLDASDILFLSDVDEIPRPSRLKELDLDQPAIFAQEWYLYWLNCKTAWQQYGTTRVPFSSAKTDFYAAAMYRWAPKQNIIRDGGWHFSYFGGLGVIKEKISGVPDIILRNAGEDIETAMLTGKGLNNSQGGYGPIGFCEVDDTFPEVITKNLAKYQHLMHPDYRDVEEKRKFYESIEQRRQRRLLIPREIETQRHKARMSEDPVYQKEYGS
jgi:beta-1,4-mannosyl-glycoprotein beta-1,4-N-acetylglucosaminyltransferase